MENNQEQLEALKNLSKFISESNAACQVLTKENPNGSLSKEKQEEQKNTYVNIMTDIIFHNPNVLVKTVSEETDAPLHHYSVGGKEKSEYLLLTVYTDAEKLNQDEHYKIMPFNEMMRLVVDDSELIGAFINPTENAKHILSKNSMEYFLSFTNITFVGF